MLLRLVRENVSCLLTRKPWTGVLATIALALLFGSGDLQAEPAVCSNTPGDGQRVACTETNGNNAIDIDLDGVSISTTTNQQSGIGVEAVKLGGTGDIDVSLTNGSVTTTGDAAHGIDASSTGTGHITVDVQDSTLNTSGRGIGAQGKANVDVSVSDTSITTTSNYFEGVLGQVNGVGNLMIDFDDVTVTSSGRGSFGVGGYFLRQTGDPKPKGTLGIDIDGGSIRATGSASYGVYAQHEGTGAIDITIKDASITTTGETITDSTDRDYNLPSFGIYSWHFGDGDTDISLTNTSVSTSGNRAHGIYGLLWNSNNTASESDVRIRVTGGSITTQDTQAHGVYSYTTGDALEIELDNVKIKTESTAIVSQSANYTFSTGIYGQHNGTGILDIDARRGSITTQGRFSYGIYARHQGSSGDISVRTYNGHSITTTGPFGHGIVGRHEGTGATRSIDITVGGTVTTEGVSAQGVRIGNVNEFNEYSHVAALDEEGYRMQTVTVNGPITSTAEGVFLANGGRVIIGPQGSIDSSSGIAVLATGHFLLDDTSSPAIQPKLRMDLNLGGRRVAQALGDNWIINDGGETTIAMNNVVLHDGATGVTGMTAPNGAWDVRMLAGGVRVTDRTTTPWTVSDRAEGVIADRDFSAQDFTEARRPAEMHQVDEAVSVGPDAMAGVHIVGDGEVHIGAQGSIEAASGIAILATGHPSGEPPELLVDMDLDGRRVSQVIGDNWIINDGGGTTLVINGVKLHDRTTGVVLGAVAPNGAFNVQFETVGGLQAQAGSMRIHKEGVRVLDRTDPDPANWVISDPAIGVIADRDFSAADFIETRPTQPMFMEEYAPRSVLYEALPDVLLRLQQRDAVRAPRSRPKRSQWIRVTGRTGSQDFKRSTVGSEYDTDYFEIEAGKHVLLDNGLDAWAALHYLDGTADVSSPVKGGDIDVQGLGLSVELCRGCDSGDWYASGRLALARYDLDLSSDTRGQLKSGVNATAWALRLETGRRLQWDRIQLTPRVRLAHANVSVDRFTDAVDARVSYSDEDRSAVALGVMVESASSATESEPSLWGSLDFEHRLGDGQTTARVSGERLTARPETDSLLLGVGGTWRRGDLTIDAGLSAREELGSGGEEYGATFSLDLRF